MTQIIDLGKIRFNFSGEWDSQVTYETNDVVKYGNGVYCYTHELNAANVVPTTTTHWKLMTESANYIGVYSGSTGYKKGDIVNYGGNLHIAKSSTTGNVPTNATYWNEFVLGFNPRGEYSNSTVYIKNDIVSYGVNLYKATQTTIAGTVPTNSSYWTLFVSGLRSTGTWSITTEYFVNDLVTYGGDTYIAKEHHTSSIFQTDKNDLKWEKFNGGMRWRGVWTTATKYLPNDAFTNGLSTYITLKEHTSNVSILSDLTALNIQVIAQGQSNIIDPSTASNGKSVVTLNGAYTLVSATRNLFAATQL